jgi:hypothetical protein
LQIFEQRKQRKSAFSFVESREYSLRSKLFQRYFLVSHKIRNFAIAWEKGGLHLRAQYSIFELSKYISRRKADFISGMMEACYIVFNGEAVVVNAKYQTRREIESIINELKP